MSYEFFENGRATVFTNQVPYDTDILRTNAYNMASSAALAKAIIGAGIGNSTTVSGLACVPTIPAGLKVQVNPGFMFSLENYDSTPYGSLPADTNADHRLYKTAFNWDPVILDVTAPPTAGNTWIYLVEGIFNTEDVNNISRPYFNSADPTSPIFNNNFDTRTDIVSLQAIPGVESPTTPVPPTPTPGWTALYYVTITNGQTTIISSNISPVSTVEGQPFIKETLTEKVSSSTLASNYVSIIDQRNSTYVFANDVGAVNAIVLNPTNNYSAYVPGTTIQFVAANTNTSATTVKINGNAVSNLRIQTAGGLIPLVGGEIVAGNLYEIIYQGSNFILKNPSRNNIYALLIEGTAQPLPSDPINLTKLKLENSFYDKYSFLDVANDRVIPIAGLYQINVSVLYTGITFSPGTIGTTFLGAIYRNGTLYFSELYITSISANELLPSQRDIICSGSTIVSASGTDHFEFWTRNANVLGASYADARISQFTMHYIGPP